MKAQYQTPPPPPPEVAVTMSRDEAVRLLDAIHSIPTNRPAALAYLAEVLDDLL